MTGSSYTLVGDGSVGISALKFAEQLLDSAAIDRCIVAGGEETDWSSARLPRMASPRHPRRGGRGPRPRPRRPHRARPHPRRRLLLPSAPRPPPPSPSPPDLAKPAPRPASSSAAATGRLSMSPSPPPSPNSSRASRLPIPSASSANRSARARCIQAVHGALALEKRQLNNVIVSSMGFNQQASGLVISRAPHPNA